MMHCCVGCFFNNVEFSLFWTGSAFKRVLSRNIARREAETPHLIEKKQEKCSVTESVQLPKVH